MRRLAASVTVVTALLLAGCSGDDGSSPDTVVGSPGTTTGAPRTTGEAPGTTEVPGTTGTTGTEAAGLDGAELEAVLLTTADLPAGWAAEPRVDDDDDDDGDAPACFRDITRQIDQGDAPDAQADFTRGDFPVLFEKVGYLGDEAAERFEIVTTGLGRCTDLALPGDDGRPIPGTIEPLPFATLGDESAAYRMAFDLRGLPLTFDVVLTRVDGVVVILLFGDLGGTSADDLPAIAQAAVAKVEAALA